MNDLLSEGLIDVRSVGVAAECCSLPDLLARFSAKKPVEFRNLQPHQSHAWRAFSAQLAASALQRAGETDLPTEPERWRELLLGLTAGQVEPWCLVVEDPKQPAFLQPPIPEGSFDVLGNESLTPEDLDLLVTAKNHDIKMERMRAPKPDHWIYALVAKQTMEGFSGRDNYGIARMNGGFASRPGVSTVSDLSWSTAFLRDVELLLSKRSELLVDWGFKDDGLALLWLKPWDGLESVEVSELDPFFIEVCRRVRLVETEAGIQVRWTTTKTARINAKEWNGRLGDIWTPVNRKDLSALTVSDRGLDYRLMVDLMFGERFEPSAAQVMDDGLGPNPFFTARVLVRGQGKTAGYHERAVPIPGKIARRMRRSAEHSRMGVEARRRESKVADAQRRVLRPALLALHQGGGDQLNVKDRVDRPFLARHDREIDRIFFEELFRDEEAGLSPEKKGERWEERVFRLTKTIFEQALAEIPAPDARHYRAIAAAERRFYGGARVQLPGAFNHEEERNAA